MGSLKRMLNLFRYHAAAMAAIHDRKKLQQDPSRKWDFVFKKPAARVILSDNVIEKEVKLHAGFNIIVILEDVNEPDNVQIATSLVDRILDTISFSTVAQCEPPKLLTEITIKNDGTSEGQFFEGPDPDSSIIIGTPRAIDENVFKEIWKACDGNPNEERILRALAWFRKAIREQYNIDQFISLFVAIEVVKPLLRDLLKTRVKDPDEWEGVIEIFKKKIKTVDFSDINLARNELLHGFKPLAPEFGSRISAYLEPLRRAIIYGLGDILGLSGQITDLICSYRPRRLFLKSQTGLKGHFRNLPELDVLLKRFPEIEINRKPMSFSIETDGKLNITFDTSQKFTLPEKTVFEADTFVMTGSEGAGVDLTGFKFND